VQITFQDGLLTTQGERHPATDAADEKVHRAERHYGAFRRSITLPSHVRTDKIEASAQDGVLLILVPRRKRRTPASTSVLAKASPR
jgi:HSP20 family protein